MATKVYDIECAMDRLDGFPKAQAFLNSIIDATAPVAFNQQDYDAAKAIAVREEAEQALITTLYH
jgi:hypothetical protein